jgi:hypothetical protein
MSTARSVLFVSLISLGISYEPAFALVTSPSLSYQFLPESRRKSSRLLAQTRAVNGGVVQVNGDVGSSGVGGDSNSSIMFVSA